MYTIQCWTPIYLAALVFTSGNISALLMMSRSSRGFETASRRLILAQNGTLIGVLFLYFASTLPMSIITNNRANNLIDDALTLMERLEAAGIASRAEMPVDTILKAPIGEILSQAQALQDREKGSTACWPSPSFSASFSHAPPSHLCDSSFVYDKVSFRRLISVLS